MGFSYRKSTQWAISAGAAGGLVPGVGASAYSVTLLDVVNQIFFPGYVAGSSIGVGLKGGLTLSTFSPTFFTVAMPMFASDFDNRLCTVVDLSLVVGAGGSASGISIWGVNHSPSVLSLSGFGVGVAGGLTLSPLMYLRINDSKAWRNPGCAITPDGDPLCGGSSPNPNQSVDPGMSR